MSKFCYIIGAGDTSSAVIKKPGMVIAADGGYEKVKELGIKPDIVIGDFDSLGYIPENETVIKYPKEKDDTDMMLAFKEGIKNGCDTFVIYGGLGGRIDHTVANIQFLGYMTKNKVRGYLVGDGYCITAIYDDTIYFDDTHTGTISVFCFGDIAEGVTIKGLKYELKDALISHTIPFAVSNEFIGKRSRISVDDGELLVMWNEDTADFIEKLYYEHG